VSPYLEEAEVAALRDGERVRITWSGGNGPHEYVIAVDEHGRRYAVSECGSPEIREQMRWYNPIEFVGVERYHTRVEVIE